MIRLRITESRAERMASQELARRLRLDQQPLTAEDELLREAEILAQIWREIEADFVIE